MFFFFALSMIFLCFTMSTVKHFNHTFSKMAKVTFTFYKKTQFIDSNNWQIN